MATFETTSHGWAFFLFHLRVGTRVALRTFTPVLAFIFAAYYLFGPKFVISIVASFIQTGFLVNGLLYSAISLSLARIAAPRVCLGLSGWIRHLPVSSQATRRPAGVENPDSGQIKIDGHDLWKNEVAARKNLAYLPEQPDLTPYATLGEILSLVCRLRKEPLEKGGEALKFFALENLASSTIRELSLGQRRRAVFAAALIGTPKHILLDEPLEGMDRNIQKEILSWIHRNIKSEALVIVVSHSIEPFLNLVTQAVTIKDGSAIHYKELPQALDKKSTKLEDIAKGIVQGESTR